MLMEMEKTELPTGHLQANIRHTRASYSRPRSMAEAEPQRKKRGKSATWEPWKRSW
jgi:hypothetical protein